MPAVQGLHASDHFFRTVLSIISAPVIIGRKAFALLFVLGARVTATYFDLVDAC